MLILGDVQNEILRAHARMLLSKLNEWKGHKDETLISVILSTVHEACGIGYSIAMGEIHSTPWEWVSQPILTDAARNDAVMNGMAVQGWEFHAASSHWVFWRRRKAVGDGQKA
jgi:hypothetical protein